jgi:hypothetical protein
VPDVNVKVVVLIVEGFIASLKVATTTEFGHIPEARLGGVTEITEGGPFKHVVLPVVKVHTKSLASELPKVSVAPVVIVAV